MQPVNNSISASPTLARAWLHSPAPAILAIVLGTAAWSHLLGFRLAGLTTVMAALSLLGALALLYTTVRPCAGLAEMSAYAALWVAFTASGCVLTYLCASLAAPLQDNLFHVGDRMLRFDWLAWAQLLHRHPAINFVLRLAYYSLIAQIAGSIIFFASIRAEGRNALLLGSAVLSLLLTAAVFAALPALGPAVTGGVPWPRDMRDVQDLLALRAGSERSWVLSDLQGFVCFPSYHTVMAILLTRAHWRLRAFWPVAVLNGVMLLSVPSEGNHYLVDMLGGGIVASASLAVMRSGWGRPAT